MIITMLLAHFSVVVWNDESNIYTITIILFVINFFKMVGKETKKENLKSTTSQGFETPKVPSFPASFLLGSRRPCRQSPLYLHSVLTEIFYCSNVCNISDSLWRGSALDIDERTRRRISVLFIPSGNYGVDGTLLPVYIRKRQANQFHCILLYFPYNKRLLHIRNSL